MFSSTLQKIACVLIILSSAVLAQAQSAAVKDPTSTISGKVSIKDKALAGIVISLTASRSSSSERRPSYKARRDVNGEYRITNVPAGTYVIMPLAPALVTTEEMRQGRTLIVNRGETIEHIDFTLLRGGAITGKVVDADGRPVIEVPVAIFAAAADNPLYQFDAIATDDRGVYRIYGLRPGSYKVAAGQNNERRFLNAGSGFYKRSYYPSVPDISKATVIELSEGGEATNVDITLGNSETTYSASGRIVDGATGQPLANVSYGVTHFTNPNSSSSMFNGAVSNSRGEFKLENLVSGKYAVRIMVQPGAGNLRGEEAPFEIIDEDVTGLVVRTHKGASLSGTIVLEGAPDKGVREELRRLSLAAVPSRPDDSGFSSWSMIGPEGTFNISGIAAGTTTLQIGNSRRFRIVRVERDGMPQARSIEVKEGETINGLRVVLAYGDATIRGVVEVTGGTLPPGARFSIWLRNIGDDPTAGSISTGPTDVDARGQFVIEGLMPGTYEVNAAVVNEQVHRALGDKRQQIVVTAGSVNNIILSVDLNSNPLKP